MKKLTYSLLENDHDSLVKKLADDGNLEAVGLGPDSRVVSYLLLTSKKQDKAVQEATSALTRAFGGCENLGSYRTPARYGGTVVNTYLSAGGSLWNVSKNRDGDFAVFVAHESEMESDRNETKRRSERSELKAKASQILQQAGFSDVDIASVLR
jgi:hypothetical protein